MKTIKSTGNQVWVLFYQWDDNDPTWWAAYDSLEALLFDFDDVYHYLTDNFDDEVTNEEIARARQELKEEARTENEDLGLYMNIEPMTIYGLREEE